MLVINLIIARTGIFEESLMKQWRRYMNKNPNIKSFFIMLDNKISEEYILTGDTIIMKGYESNVPGIYQKTLRAMKICLEKKEYNDVKYFIRTNISSFWIWDRLLKFLKDVPTNNYAGTGHIMIKIDRNWDSPTGSNMILSRDIVKLLINHYDYADAKNVADDVAIGGVLNKCSVLLKKYPWFVCIDALDPKNVRNTIMQVINTIPEDVFTIRNNLSSLKLRNEHEEYTYSKLVDKFY
jgi:hypothetical protein